MTTRRRRTKLMSPLTTRYIAQAAGAISSFVTLRVWWTNPNADWRFLAWGVGIGFVVLLLSPFIRRIIRFYTALWLMGFIRSIIWRVMGPSVFPDGPGRVDDENAPFRLWLNNKWDDDQGKPKRRR